MRTALALALLVLVAACSSTAPGATVPVVARTTPPASASPQAVTFRIQETHCGRYTAAQRKTFSTNATSGFVATVTNTGTAPGEVQLSVNFAHAGLVDANNTSGFSPPLAPGQSAVIEVDNVTNGGQDGNPADTCTPVQMYERPAPGQVAGVG